MNLEFHILVGLPGSGKTTFAKKLVEHDSCAFHYERDEIKNRTAYTWFQEKIKSLFDWSFGHDDKTYKFIFDTLCCTNAEFEQIISDIITAIDNEKKKESIRLPKIKDVLFVCHQWNEDRETCLSNDKCRLLSRKMLSTHTIKTRTYETINIDEIKDKFFEDYMNTFGPYASIQFRYTSHIVQYANDYERFYKHYINSNESKKDLMCSEQWSLGGSCCSYDGSYDEVSADKEPYFKEFDDFITTHYPKLLFTEYLQLRDKCVTKEEYSEPDYYGGEVRYAKWCCDMKVLYKMLKTMGYKMELSEKSQVEYTEEAC